MLRTVVLAFHHQPRRQVGDAHGGIGLVDVLAARAAGTERVDAQVIGVDDDFRHLVGFGHDRHGAGRRVDATLRFGGGHALHAVRTGLELQAAIGAVAVNTRDHFLVAAQFRGAFRHQLDAPAARFRIARVHAQQVAREQRAFIATRARADFQEHAAPVIGVARQQQQLQRAFQAFQLASARLDLVFGHGLHVRVGQHFLRRRQVFLGAGEGGEGLDHGFQLGAFARELAETVHIGRGFRLGEQRVHLDQAVTQMLQPAAHGRFHGE
ncbi:hypothetical protein D3C72_1387340 [compost metagenome]